MALTNYNAKRTIYVFMNGTQDCQTSYQTGLWLACQWLDSPVTYSDKPERRRLRDKA